MLLVHLLLSIVPETCYSRIPALQEDNVVEDCHASTINKSQPAYPHLATAMEASFIGNHDKQPNWNKVGSQKSVSCNGCIETQTGHFKTFFKTPGGCNSTASLQKAYVHIIFSCTVVYKPTVGSAVQFSFTLYMQDGLTNTLA